MWEGLQEQAKDQPRGLNRTIDRVITFAKRRLLHDDLEAGTDPRVLVRHPVNLTHHESHLEAYVFKTIIDQTGICRLVVSHPLTHRSLG